VVLQELNTVDVDLKAIAMVLPEIRTDLSHVQVLLNKEVVEASSGRNENLKMMIGLMKAQKQGQVGLAAIVQAPPADQMRDAATKGIKDIVDKINLQGDEIEGQNKELAAGVMKILALLQSQASDKDANLLKLLKLQEIEQKEILQRLEMIGKHSAAAPVATAATAVVPAVSADAKDATIRQLQAQLALLKQKDEINLKQLDHLQRQVLAAAATSGSDVATTVAGVASQAELGQLQCHPKKPIQRQIYRSFVRPQNSQEDKAFVKIFPANMVELPYRLCMVSLVVDGKKE
jgi:hypothetical protein